MPYCLGCGYAISESDRFCNGCGRRTLSPEERIYNDLPVLGKLRLTKNNAHIAQAGTVVAVAATYGLGTLLMGPFLGLLPASTVGRWAFYKCREMSKVVHDAELGREAMLCSKEEFHTRRAREERDMWFKVAKKLRTRVSRRKANIIVMTPLIMGVATLFGKISGDPVGFSWWPLVIASTFCTILNAAHLRSKKKELKAAAEAQSRAEEIDRGGRSGYAEECERELQALRL